MCVWFYGKKTNAFILTLVSNSALKVWRENSVNDVDCYLKSQEDFSHCCFSPLVFQRKKSAVSYLNSPLHQGTRKRGPYETLVHGSKTTGDR